jgi:hypothetical protein
LPTLVFSIPTLNLFVLALLDFSLEHAGSLRFVKSCDFQDLSRVEPRVSAPAHDSNALAHPRRVAINELRLECGMNYSHLEHGNPTVSCLGLWAT